MYLKTLKIKGFKSFATQTVIDFKPGFSVIIGPNGTGKSNIVDAILWVLGEQNPRFLRGQSMTDVIFAGNKFLKPAPFAEVTLVFDNSKGTLPVDSSEVSIKRRVTADGEGTYFINERVCRLLDIRELLSHMGLGVELPGIIPQNRISELINPASTDLRAIIEEASGVAAYRRKKEMSLRKLTSVDGKLERIEAIKREVSAELKPLKKQVNEYYQIIEARQQLDKARTKLLVSMLPNFRENYENTQREIEIIKRELEKLNAEKDSLQQRKKALNETIENTRYRDRNLTAYQRLKELRTSLSTLYQLAEEKGKNFIQEMSNLHQQISSQNIRKTKLQNELKKRSKQLEEVEQEISRLQVKEAEIEAARKKLEAELQKARKEHEKLTSTLAQIEDLLLQSQSAVSKKESSLEALMEQFKQLSQKLDAVRLKLNELEQERQKLIGDVETGTQTSSVSVLKKEKERLEAYRRILSKELENVEKRIADTKEAIEGLKKSLKTDLNSISRLFSENMFDIAHAALAPFPELTVIDKLNEGENNLPDSFILADLTGHLKQHLETFSRTATLKEAVELFDGKTGFITESGFVLLNNGVAFRYAGKSTHFSKEKRLKELRKALESLHSERDSILRELKSIESELNRLDSAITKMSAFERLEHIENERQKLLPVVEEINEQIDSLTELISSREQEFNDLMQRHADLKKEAEEAREKEVAASEKVVAIKKKIAELDKEASHITSSLHELQTRKHFLEQLKQRTSEDIKTVLALVEELESRARLRDANRHRLVEVSQLYQDFLSTVDFIIAQKADYQNYEKLINSYQQQVEEILSSMERIHEREAKLNTRLNALEAQLDSLEEKIASAVHELEETTGKPVSETLKEYENEALESPEVLQRQVDSLKKRVAEMGDYNPFAVRDYERLKEKLEFYRAQANDIRRAVSNLQQIIERVDEIISEKFNRSLNMLNENFDHEFSRLFSGGTARLEFTDDTGFVRIYAQPPGKNLKNINLLSGGEKSLTAMALVIALQETFDVPFVVFDEVEPALDEVNLRKLIARIRELANKRQVIMITHQPLTIEAADIIYGISLNRKGVSSIYSMKLKEEAEIS